MEIYKNIPGFMTGEIATSVSGRVDFDKYHTACERLENLLIKAQGPVTRRPGSRYVTATKTSSKKSRMITFKFNVTDSRVLEFGDGYIRIFKSDATTGVGEQLRRVTTATCTLSATTGSGITFTASSAVFTSADVGKVIRMGDSLATITGYTSTTVVTCTITVNWPATYNQTGWDYTTKVISSGYWHVIEEIASPYLEAHIWEIKDHQDADVMYLVHPNFAPRKLSRASDTSWSLSVTKFNPRPSYIANTDLSATCVLGAITGTDITFTAGSAVFRKADVGRALIMGASKAIITEWVSNSAVKCDIEDDWPGADATGWTFSTKTIASGSWYLIGSPVADITPNENGPVGKIVNVILTESGDDHSVTLSNSGSKITVSYKSHGLSAGDYVLIKGAENSKYNGIFVVLGDADAPTTDTFKYTAKKDPNAVAGGYPTCSVFYPGFRDADVGKVIKTNEGLLRIKSIVSSGVVKAVIMGVMKDKDTVYAGSWSLETRSWPINDNGTADANQVYPSLVGGHQNRLLLASTSNQPTTVWSSVTGGDNENFATGVKDDDALDYTLSTRNKLRWLLTHRVIMVGTGGEEIMLGAESNKALTPTNVRAIIQSNIGGAAVKPFLVNSAILFLQQSKNKLWEFTYNFEEDSYKGVDMTILAEHITLPTLGGTNWDSSGIVDMAYQKEPTPIIWCVRNDGMLLALTYQRNDNVVGWGKHITGQLDAQDPPVTNGWVESVCIEPVNGRDRVWLIVKRTINGATKRYVEYFDDNAWTSTEGWQWGELLSDSAKVYSGAAITTMTGLDHLAGKVVCVLGDGKLQTEKTVPSSAPFNITIDSASHVEVGLPYVSIGITVRPEAQLPNGTIQGRQKGWANLVARLHNTMGGYLNDTPMEYHVVAGVKTLFTGDYEVHNLGYDKGGRVCFEQWDPLPFTILSLSGKLTIGD